MKTTRLLRLLSLLGFLLFFAPFYDSCSDKKGLFIKSYDEINSDGTKVEKTFFDNTYNIIVDELSLNGFEIASFFVYGVQEFKSFDEFKSEISKSFQQKDWYKNIGLFISVLFGFIVLISFSMFVLTFTKKIIYLNKLTLVNCILVLVTFLYIIFLESSFENWNQIKWGYYAFIITNLLVFYFSKPETRNPKPETRNLKLQNAILSYKFSSKLTIYSILFIGIKVD